MRIFQYGNKAALVVGIALMVADSLIPLAQEFGAWKVGCLLCVWYSASAIKEDVRINVKLKKWLYAYLAIVFVLAILLYDSADTQTRNGSWSIQSSLKALGIEGR